MADFKYRIPMIFPGQGSQYVGMASDLVQGPQAGAAFLARVDSILEDSLTAIMFDGPAESLTETRNAQPALLAHSVAVGLALREMGVVPSLVAGHSLGEFSAAVTAGALSPEDGLRLVRQRGDLMFAAGQENPGTMAAVLGLSGERVTAVCAEVSAAGGVVVLANHNSEAQVVISGEIAAVNQAAEALKTAGARRVIPLNVSGAFHSPLLESAGQAFAAYLDGVAVMDAPVPVVANVSAAAVVAAADLKAGFARQLTAPVLWHDSMKRIAASDAPVVLEVGPGKVLSNLAKRAYPEVKFLSVGTVEDLTGVLGFLQEHVSPAS